MTIWKTAVLTLAIAFLASCGGQGNKSPAPPPAPAPVTIPDLRPYLAQSVRPDGNPATPLHESDLLTYQRFDFGHYQASNSFLTSDGGAITTWSYSPWGPFNASLGDGGEKYEINGDAALIVSTQHLGTGGVVQLLPRWTAATRQTIDCSQGWTAYDPVERGCRAVVNYPSIGPVDTIISEHAGPEFTERIFLGLGWGRLAWQTFRPIGVTPVDRCPDFGWNSLGSLVLTDCRIAVNLEASGAGLTGAQLWHP